MEAGFLRKMALQKDLTVTLSRRFGLLSSLLIFIGITGGLKNVFALGWLVFTLCLIALVAVGMLPDEE